MNRTKSVGQFFTAVSTAVAVVCAQQATSWIQARQFPRWFPLIAALMIVVIGSQVIRLLLERLFESSAVLKRALLGREFVAGTWVDIMYRDGKKIAFGVSHIDHTGSTVCYSGEEFSLDGKVQGHYVTDLMKLEWPKMKYKYTFQLSSNAEISSQGYGEAQFTEREGPPKRYTGFYFDFRDGKKVTFVGWRMDDPIFLARLDDPGARELALREFYLLRAHQLSQGE